MNSLRLGENLGSFTMATIRTLPLMQLAFNVFDIHEEAYHIPQRDKVVRIDEIVTLFTITIT